LINDSLSPRIGDRRIASNAAEICRCSGPAPVDLPDPISPDKPAVGRRARDESAHIHGRNSLHCVIDIVSISTTYFRVTVIEQKFRRRRGRGRSISTISLMRPGERVITTTLSDRIPPLNRMGTNITVLRRVSQIFEGNLRRRVRVFYPARTKRLVLSNTAGGRPGTRHATRCSSPDNSFGRISQTLRPPVDHARLCASASACFCPAAGA